MMALDNNKIYCWREKWQRCRHRQSHDDDDDDESDADEDEEAQKKASTKQNTDRTR